MSMSYLTSHSMLAISHDILNDSVKLSLLERDELTKNWIPRLRKVHDELALLTKVDGDLQARLREISEELRVCDQIHDRIARGIYRGLESTADLCATAEEGRVFIEIRDLLFPDGLSINSLSYRDQSGNVLKVSQQATASIRAVLANIVPNGRTFEQSFDVWVANGEKMGKLVAERAILSGEEDDTRVSAGDLREVRNRWILTFNVLLSALNLLEMSDADRRRLLSNLRDAEAAAVRTRAAEQRRKVQVEGGEVAGGDVVGGVVVDTGEDGGQVSDESSVNPVAEDV